MTTRTRWTMYKYTTTIITIDNDPTTDWHGDRSTNTDDKYNGNNKYNIDSDGTAMTKTDMVIETRTQTINTTEIITITSTATTQTRTNADMVIEARTQAINTTEIITITSTATAQTRTKTDIDRKSVV